MAGASLARQHRCWPGVFLLLLLLLACRGGEEGNRPPEPATPGGVIISTVEPSPGGTASRPTEALPTATSAPTPTPTPPAPVAAVVNGQYLFLADYERQVSQLEQALVAQGLDPDTEEGQAQLAERRQQVLDSLIDYLLIEQGAASVGVTLSEAELEAQMEADIAAGGGEAAFEQWLQATGQTRDGYKESLRQAMLSQRVFEAVTAGVSDVAEQVHARHIVLGSEEAGRQVLARLREGADFAALAREQSLDLATKDNGGDLGWFPRGLVAPELENAAFALQPGGISDLILLGDGYHILQVVEREAARPLSPEMQMDLKLAVFERWLAERRDAATIERFVGE